MIDKEEVLSDLEIRGLAERYHLVLDAVSSAGTFGVKAGKETGASVEIQDFRNYVPGDDPRRIDWFSYARTGNLIVRLFREEVSPFFDIIVDSSASMGIRDGRKEALARELCAWLYHAARAEGIAVRLFSAGRAFERLHEPKEMTFGDPESSLFVAPNRAVSGLRRSSVRLILSDFMSPRGVRAAISAVATGCTRLIVVQLLGPWEADPDPKGPARLDAVEEGRKADITLDRKTVEGYRRRLRALKNEVREEVFRWGGLQMEMVADRGLEQVLREQWLPLGLVEVI